MTLYNFIKNWKLKNYAIMKNDDGDTLDKVRFKLEDDVFYYKNKTYNVKRKHMFREVFEGTITTSHYYFYNIKYSDPLDFSIDSGKLEPIMNPEVYNTLLEAKVLISLNKLVDKGLFSNIGLDKVLYILGAGAVLIYIMVTGAV